MATDVWALSAIASPATTDRVPIATGSNTGGYSLRAEFVWKGGGVFKADAPVQITAASGNAVLNLIETGVRNWALRSGALTTNVFDIVDLTGGASRFSINQSGHVGIGGVNASTRLHVKSSLEMARFETTTARGSGNGFVSFYDPTGRKCFIGYGALNDDLHFMNDLSGQVGFGNGGTFRWAINTSGHFYPVADNTYSLGVSGGRATVVYAATGTINTSDADDKDWLGTGFSPELLSAAKRIAAEIGSYKWLDSIQRETEGGPAARIHFGVRAQAVWEIMADEGLIDPLQEGVTPSSPYAFLCWDEVEDRPEGRFGIRPDQLTVFLIAAQEARIAALEDLLP